MSHGGRRNTEVAASRVSGAASAHYAYNAFHQRTAKTSGGQTTHYLYDPAGQLLAKLDGATGQAIVTTNTIPFHLRFPGRYFDAETGLHYNWHRYYDPQTGATFIGRSLVMAAHGTFGLLGVIKAALRNLSVVTTSGRTRFDG
ncbi:MAG TPA: RHS repeat-associated core domain-containing protein [Gammaproteobacteria bacterium]|nr:RHS repeat-associated core domain-containing protein [Gammaproteobacteria bacterium]